MLRGDEVRSSRDQILDSARDLISSHGYDGMVISDLSSASGLPASSIYYHFGNKLGVLAALLQRTFEELHASFPEPSSYDEADPLTRFELWLRAACVALDERPEYLRLLLAVSVGSMMEDEAVRDIVRRIRDYAHSSWVDALRPLVLEVVHPAAADGLVRELAFLGRAVIDGLAVTASLDGVSYSSHVDTILTLVRSGLRRGELRSQPSGG